MSARVLFIDLENVQRVDLGRVPFDARVIVFYGIAQTRLYEKWAVQAEPLGERIRWIKISGQGPNALDFYIAFYLGQELASDPNSECAILSRDTGFDPLIRHLRAFGRACRRVGSLNEAFRVQPPSTKTDHPFTRLLTLLRKEKNRPAKLKSLAGYVKSSFPSLTAEERSELVQRLLTESRVCDSGKRLTYSLG